MKIEHTKARVPQLLQAMKDKEKKHEGRAGGGTPHPALPTFTYKAIFGMHIGECRVRGITIAEGRGGLHPFIRNKMVLGNFLRLTHQENDNHRQLPNSQLSQQSKQP